VSKLINLFFPGALEILNFDIFGLRIVCGGGGGG
jgi:hypothetical protein